MAKTEKKNHSELKFLKQKIRDLEQENKRLKRQMAQVEKYKHISEPESKEEVEEYHESAVVKKGIPCDACGKGFYKEFEIMDKCFGTCNICEDRKRLK